VSAPQADDEELSSEVEEGVLSESYAPGTGPVLTIGELVDLSSVPGHSTVFRQEPPDPINNTRRILAYGALIVLVVFYAAILLFFVVGKIDLNEVGQLIAVFSGLQTLAATAFGFYFAREK